MLVVTGLLTYSISYMSIEHPDKESSKGIDGIADKIMNQILNGYPNAAMNEAVHLTYQTDYAAGDVLRIAANRILRGDDTDKHDRLYGYLEWEAKTVPDVSSAWLLIRRAAGDINTNDRLYIGVQQLTAALDYIQRALEKTPDSVNGDYIDQLDDVFTMLAENSDLLGELYTKAGMTFGDYIAQASTMTEAVNTLQDSTVIDRLLVHVSKSIGENNPTNAKRAREHIGNQQQKDEAESYQTGLEIWHALEANDILAVQELLSNDSLEINEIMWRKLEDSYGFAQYTQAWVRDFIHVIADSRPNYFENLGANSSRDFSYGATVGHVLGLAAQYDTIDAVLSVDPNDSAMDLAIAAEVARAYGKREDFEGMSRLMKIDRFDADIKKKLAKLFSIGSDEPHFTKHLY